MNIFFNTSRILFVLFFGILFFFSSTPVDAVTETTLGSQLAATITPANPGPGERTTIALTSYTIDLRSSTISWRVNGVEAKRGVGEVQHALTVGAAGSRTSVVITVTNTTGGTTQKTLVFVPQELGVTWEAQTYTPPLYKGKALPAAGSLIRLIALPEFKTEGGVAISPLNLNYRWQQNFQDIEGGAGKGVQTVSVKANVLGNTKVSVDVSSADGVFRATKVIEIETTTPEILFYQDKPLLGTDYSASFAGATTLTTTETTVRAEPFNYSLPLRTILFSWFMNGAAAKADEINPQLITLRKEKGTQGSAQVQASVSVPGFLFQEGRSSFTAQFGN